MSSAVGGWRYTHRCAQTGQRRDAVRTAPTPGPRPTRLVRPLATIGLVHAEQPWFCTLTCTCRASKRDGFRHGPVHMKSRALAYVGSAIGWGPRGPPLFYRALSRQNPRSPAVEPTPPQAVVVVPRLRCHHDTTSSAPLFVPSRPSGSVLPPLEDASPPSDRACILTRGALADPNFRAARERTVTAGAPRSTDLAPGDAERLRRLSFLRPRHASLRYAHLIAAIVLWASVRSKRRRRGRSMPPSHRHHPLQPR